MTDVRTGRTRHRFPYCEHQPNAIAFSSDGELVAVSGDDSRQGGEENTYVTTVFNLRTGDIRKVLHGQRVFLFGVNLGPEIRLVAVSPGGEQLWNVETERVLKTLKETYPNQRAGQMMSISLCPACLLCRWHSACPPASYQSYLKHLHLELAGQKPPFDTG